MEYVIVSCPEDHEVLIDGRVAGKTNTVIMVEAGTHEFDLGRPAIYAPKLAVVTDTSSISPLHIDFAKS